MKTVDSIPQMLNEIFSEFNEASKVGVCYQSYAAANNDTGSQMYRITSVNGHKSLPSFRLALYEMQETLLHRLMLTENELEPVNRSNFLRQGLHKCKKLLSVTNPAGFGYEEANCAEPDIPCHVFREPSCMNIDNPVVATESEPVIHELSLLTKPYADSWVRVVHDIRDEFQYALGRMEAMHNQVLREQNNKQDRNEERKIRVKSNLPLLAAFFRMMFDLRVFDMDNKSRFCRVVVNLFDTHYKKKLSADNFRNHFDAPSPEDVEKLIALLVKMLHYLRNFKFNL